MGEDSVRLSLLTVEDSSVLTPSSVREVPRPVSFPNVMDNAVQRHRQPCNSIELCFLN